MRAVTAGAVAAIFGGADVGVDPRRRRRPVRRPDRRLQRPQLTPSAHLGGILSAVDLGGDPSRNCRDGSAPRSACSVSLSDGARRRTPGGRGPRDARTTYADDHHGLVTTGGGRRDAGHRRRATWYRAVDTAARSSRCIPDVARLVGAAVDPSSRRIAAAVLAAGRGRDGVAPVGGPPVGHPTARRRPGRRDAGRAQPARRTLDGRRRPPATRSPGPDRRCCAGTSARRTSCALLVRSRCRRSARRSPAAVGHVVTTGLASPVGPAHGGRRAHPRAGAHGVPAFRDALDEWVIDGKPVDSVLEPADAHAGRRPTGCRPSSSTRSSSGYEVDFWIIDTTDRPRVRRLGRPTAATSVQFEKRPDAATRELAARGLHRRALHLPRRSPTTGGDGGRHASVRWSARWAPHLLLGGRSFSDSREGSAPRRPVTKIAPRLGGRGSAASGVPGMLSSPRSMGPRPSGSSSRAAPGDGHRPDEAVHGDARHVARRDRHRPRRRQGAEDGQQLRLPRPAPLLRRRHLPPHHQRLHVPGRRPDRHRPRRPRLPLRRRAAQAAASTRSARWPWPTPARTPTAASSSWSPGRRRRPAAAVQPVRPDRQGPRRARHRCSASRPAAATARSTTSSSTRSRSPNPTDVVGALDGRTAIVTGASRGIGAAIASPSTPPAPASRSSPARADQLDAVAADLTNDPVVIPADLGTRRRTRRGGRRRPRRVRRSPRRARQQRRHRAAQGQRDAARSTRSTCSGTSTSARRCWLTAAVLPGDARRRRAGRSSRSARSAGCRGAPRRAALRGDARPPSTG